MALTVGERMSKSNGTVLKANQLIGLNVSLCFADIVCAIVCALIMIKSIR